MNAERMIGANIQRGEILSITASGVTVHSLETGIVSPPLQALPGLIVAPGQRVLYFEFADGEGYIIGITP